MQALDYACAYVCAQEKSNVAMVERMQSSLEEIIEAKDNLAEASSIEEKTAPTPMAHAETVRKVGRIAALRRTATNLKHAAASHAHLPHHHHHGHHGHHHGHRHATSGSTTHNNGAEGSVHIAFGLGAKLDHSADAHRDLDEALATQPDGPRIKADTIRKRVGHRRWLVSPRTGALRVKDQQVEWLSRIIYPLTYCLFIGVRFSQVPEAAEPGVIPSWYATANATASN